MKRWGGCWRGGGVVLSSLGGGWSPGVGRVVAWCCEGEGSCRVDAARLLGRAGHDVVRDDVAREGGS